MSRRDARSTSLRHRPARTVPASITAVVLLALGVALVWIAVLRLVRGAWPGFLGGVGSWLGALTWGSALATGIAIAVAVIGLVLLVAALTPGALNAVALTDRDAGESDGGPATTEYVMTRRSVARLATAYADLVDGVDAASATVTHRRVDLRVRTPSEQQSDVSDAVTTRVRGALSEAGVHPLPTIRTVVRTSRV